VNWYSEVFDLLFPGLDQDAARTVWQKALAKPEKASRDVDNE
jgi:Lon-like ATP-dependent protease